MFKYLTRQNILVAILTVMIVALSILGGYSAGDILSDRINTSTELYSTLPADF